MKEPRLFLGKELDLYYQNINYYFEIKSKINSVGELMRQIRLYQHYKKGKYFVVSPDKKVTEILASQKISHIWYDHNRFEPDEAILPDGTKILIPPK